MKKTIVSLAAAAFISTGAAAAADASELYTVKQGDTLFSIANQYKITVVQLMEMNRLESDKLSIQDQLIVPEVGEMEKAASGPAEQTADILGEKEEVMVSAAASYTVKSGDSLSLIASRYKTSVAALKQLNGLTSDFLQVGQRLKVNGTAPSAVKTTLLPSSKTAKPSSAGTYAVQSGDSLSKIASLYKTSVASLRQLNGLTSNHIYVGQKLKVSGQASVPNQPAAAKAAPAASGSYTVKSGDTLGAIASRYKTSVASLKQVNGLDSDTIYLGQILKVNGQALAQDKSPASAKPAPSAPNGVYTVKSGDSLSRIASNHSMTVAALKQMNGLKSDVIFSGQKLKVAAGSGTNTAPVQVDKPSFSEEYSVEKLLRTASSLKGTPYVWGGASPSGFDCSGFIYYVYKEAGKNISRTNTEGYYNRSYEISNPSPGDLVFFSNTYKKGISHMGIYIGDNQFVHASSSTGVAITSLDNVYFQSKFTSFKRFY